MPISTHAAAVRARSSVPEPPDTKGGSCKRTFSQELRALADEFQGRPATLAELLAATQGRGFDLLLLVISLPFLTPIPLLGLSTLFGVVVCHDRSSPRGWASILATPLFA